uniref:Uncharacterized protein n=1 Tax=Aegilops tauschii subsp. strangulata TaxID=200361 RepID=A0A453KAL2_AEGTS
KSILIPLKLCSEQYAKGETTDDYCWIKLILFVQVDLECSNGRNTIGLFSHRKLSVSVGHSTAAFVQAVLEGSTQPGVWFPEEPEGIAIESRKLLLERASQGTTNFVMNK